MIIGQSWVTKELAFATHPPALHPTCCTTTSFHNQNQANFISFQSVHKKQNHHLLQCPSMSKSMLDVLLLEDGSDLPSDVQCDKEGSYQTKPTNNNSSTSSSLLSADPEPSDPKPLPATVAFQENFHANYTHYLVQYTNSKDFNQHCKQSKFLNRDLVLPPGL